MAFQRSEYDRLMQAVVTMYNYQQFRHIGPPGWQLGWTWAEKEVIWSMVGAQTIEQGDCSHFKATFPTVVRKNPVVVDLLPGTPYNMQIANCYKAGVISTFRARLAPLPPAPAPPDKSCADHCSDEPVFSLHLFCLTAAQVL